MNSPLELPGISGLQEIGRSSLVVGYRGTNSDGMVVVVEVFVGGGEESRREFFRGSALQRRMAHPGMPPVIMVGESEQKLYRVREYVQGRPGTILFTEGPLSEERLFASARALVSTLKAMHQRGYVHTEVQPHGLRVDSSGLIRFLDTGRSWAVRSPLPEVLRLKMTGFLAPEYAAGAPARCESDIYSLGLVLLSLAVGRPSLGVQEGLLALKTLDLSPAMKVLLRSMLAEEPGRRPEAHTVYETLVGLQDLNALMSLHTWKPSPKAETFLGSHPYPLVGREKEMARLLGFWRRCERGRSLSLTVLGERGAGKRRLAEELRRVVSKAGGAVCRRQQEAVSGKPTLIICPSHQGRLPFPSDEPWLRLSFAEAEPVPDQELLRLGPLPTGSCLHLAKSYLADSIPEELHDKIVKRGEQLPGSLLRSLDLACEDGRLRPHFRGWSYSEKAGIEPVTLSKRKASARSASWSFQADEARQSFLELWPAIGEEDQPVASGLKALCTVLQCRRVDLYSVDESGPNHVGASSSGPRRHSSLFGIKDGE